MNITEYVTGTTFSSNVQTTRRSYKKIYRGFPVLNSNITPSLPNYRTITYRGVRGVVSNIQSERSVYSHQVIYRGCPLKAMTA